METRLIERFLSKNSALIVDNVPTARVTQVKAKDRFRPDKIYGATATMKWDMVLAGIDSPYMMAKGRALAVADEAALKSELVELEDFTL